MATDWSKYFGTASNKPTTATSKATGNKATGKKDKREEDQIDWGSFFGTTTTDTEETGNPNDQVLNPNGTTGAGQMTREEWKNYKASQDAYVQSQKNQQMAENGYRDAYDTASNTVKDKQQALDDVNWWNKLWNTEKARTAKKELSEAQTAQQEAYTDLIGWDYAKSRKMVGDYVNDAQKQLDKLKAEGGSQADIDWAQAQVDYGTAVKEYNNRQKQTAEWDTERQEAEKSGVNSAAYYNRLQAEADELYNSYKQARAAALNTNSDAMIGDVTTPEQKKALDDAEAEALRAYYAAQEKANYAKNHQYDYIKNSEDFATKSAAGKTQTENSGAYEVRNQFTDEQLEKYRKANGSAGMVYAAANDTTKPNSLGTKWTEDELNTYYYLIGNGETDKANEYAVGINNAHVIEGKDAKLAEYSEWAEDRPFLGALRGYAGSIGTMATAPAEAMYHAFEAGVSAAANGGKIQYTANKNITLQERNEAVTSGTAARLNELGKIPDNKFTQAIGLGDKGWGDLYQLTQSVVQSQANAAVARATGAEWLTDIVFFSQSFNSALRENMARGIDANKATYVAVAAGIAEAMFEHISLDALLKNTVAPTSVGQYVKQILAQAGIEGTEELNTSLANALCETIILGDKSTINESVKQYVLEGMSQQEAEKKAMKEWASGLVFDFIGGAFSGGLGAGGGMVLNGISTYNEGYGRKYALASADTLITAAQRSTSEKAQEFGEKYSGKRTLNNFQANQIKSALSENASEVYNTAVTEELTKRGVSAEDAGAIASYIKKNASEETRSEITRSEQEAFDRNQKSAEGVMTEYYGAKKAEGKRAEWTTAPQEKLYKKPGDTQFTIRDEKDGKVKQVHTAAVTVNEDGEMKVQAKVEGKDEYAQVDWSQLPEEQRVLFNRIAAVTDSKPIAAAIFNAYAQNAEGKSEKAFISAAANITALARSGAAFDNAHIQKAAAVIGTETAQQMYNEAKQAGIDERATQAGPVQRKSGTVSTEGATIKTSKGEQVLAGVDKSKMSVKERADFAKAERFLQVMAKGLGIDIIVYDSAANGSRFNGAYANRTVYLDIRAGGDNLGKSGMAVTMGHELTHFMQQNDKQTYSELQQFVFTKLAESGKLADLLTQQMNSLTYTNGVGAILDEVVADACSDMMLNSSLVTEFATDYAESAGKVQKWVNNFLKRVRNIFVAESWSAEAAAMRDYANEMQTIWDKGIRNAAKLQVTAAAEIDAVEAIREDSPKVDAESVVKASEKETNYATVERNENGELLLAQNADHSTIIYSEKTYNEGGKDKLVQALLDNGYSEKDIKTLTGELEAQLKFLHELGDQLKDEKGYSKLQTNLQAAIATSVITGKQVLSTLVNNGDYPLNLDLSLICKKRVAYMRVMNRLIADSVLSQVTYDAKTIAKVNEVLRKNGFETACLGCFVESRRLQFQEWAETVVNEWNREVLKLNKNAGYFGFYKGEMHKLTADEIAEIQAEIERDRENDDLNDQGNFKAGQGSSVTKMRNYLQEHPSQRKLLTVADLLTPDGLKQMKGKSTTLFSLAKGRYGAAAPKIVQEFNPYNGEIASLSYSFVKEMIHESLPGRMSYVAAMKAELKQRKGESNEAYSARVEREAIKKYCYDIGGVRMQSFSDFMIENTFDMLQIFADMTARKLPMHGYTKEISALRLFGMTGMKFNGSWIAHTDRAALRQLAAQELKEFSVAEDSAAETDILKKYAGLLPLEEAQKDAAGGRNALIVTVDGKQYAIAMDDVDRHNRTGSYQQSIGLKDMLAQQLDPRYSKNIGSITIGVSDLQIRAMLNDPRFRMVIPYHKIGMNPVYAHMMQVDTYNDYTNYQNTTVLEYFTLDMQRRGTEAFRKNNAKKDAIKPNTHFDFNECLQRHQAAGEVNAAKAAADEYIEWCGKYHEVYDGDKLVGYVTFKPKFSDSPFGYDFTKEKNYYKLLEDFNVADYNGDNARQGAVTMTFPSEENTLTALGLRDEYERRLRGADCFSEAEIQNYLQRGDMTFQELLSEELNARADLEAELELKWEDTAAEIEDVLMNSGEVQRSTSEERQANRDYRKREDALKKSVKALEAEVKQLRDIKNRTEAQQAELNDKLVQLAQMQWEKKTVSEIVKLEKAKNKTEAQEDRLLELKQSVVVQASEKVIGGTRELSDVEKKAVEIFGVTDDFNEAGYILPDGRLLRFTNDARKGDRGYDHRAIAIAYGKDIDLTKNNGADMYATPYLERFVEEGSIRIEPGSYDLLFDAGLQLSSDVPITREQSITIAKFVKWNNQRQIDSGIYSEPLPIHVEFGGNANYAPGMVNVNDTNAWGVPALHFEGSNINPLGVVERIKRYYRSGETAQQSLVSRFHYSEKVASAEKETDAQKKAARVYVEYKNKAEFDRRFADTFAAIKAEGRTVKIQKSDLPAPSDILKGGKTYPERTVIKELIRSLYGNDTISFQRNGKCVDAYFTKDGKSHTAGGNNSNEKANFIRFVREIAASAQYAFSSWHDAHSFESNGKQIAWDYFCAVFDVADNYGEGGTKYDILFTLRDIETDKREQIYKAEIKKETPYRHENGTAVTAVDATSNYTDLGVSEGNDTTGSGELQASEKTDSKGRTLSEGQLEFFRDSKIRDEEDRLIPVYHATDNEFTVFDRERLGEVTDVNANYVSLAATSHVGFWFNSGDISKRTMQGKSLEGYLNIKHPYYAGTVEGLANDIIDHSDGDYDSLQEEFETEDYRKVSKDLGEGFKSWLEWNGYDGVIVEDEEFGGTSYVALNPNQFKNATNLEPTESEDIRYSEKTGDRSDLEVLQQAYEDSAATPEQQQAMVSFREQVQRYEDARSALTIAQTDDKNESTPASRKAKLEAQRTFNREQKILAGMVNNNADLRKVINAERSITTKAVNTADREAFNAKYRTMDEQHREIEKLQRAALKAQQTKAEKDARVAYELGRQLGQQEGLKHASYEAWEKFKLELENGKLQERIEQMKQEKRTAMDELRKDRDLKLAAQADRYQKAAHQKVVDRQKTAARKKIQKLADDMDKRLRNPQNNHYVPKALYEPTIELLQAINMDKWDADAQVAAINAEIAKLKPEAANYDQRLDELIQKRDRFVDRGDKFRAKMSEIYTQYEALKQDAQAEAQYDPAVADALRMLPDIIGTTSIRAMSEEQLFATYKTLRMMDKVIRDSVTAKLVGEEIEASEVARGLIDESKKAKAFSSKLYGGYLDMLNPKVVFERFGGWRKNGMWEKMYRTINEGQLKMTRLTMEMRKPFESLLNGKNEKAFREFQGRTKTNGTDKSKLYDIGLKDENGVPIRIPMDMICGIYMDTLNEGNARHLAQGGKIIPDLDAYYKGKGGFGKGERHAVGFSVELSKALRELNQAKRKLAETSKHESDEYTAAEERVKAAKEAIADIKTEQAEYLQTIQDNCWKLIKNNAYARQWIERTQFLFDEQSKQYLNETTEAVYGFEKAQEEHYYPIRTNSDFRQATFDTVTRDMSLENVGFMKERINGANPTQGLGIADVVNSQIEQTARYCGMMPAIREFQKAYGKTESGYASSVQNELRKETDGYGNDYINKFMANMTGSRRGDKGIADGVLSALRGNLARTTLTMNMNVALAQTASLPTASAVLGHAAILHALNPAVKVDTEEIAKYTPLYWLRMQGFSTQELGDISNANDPLSKAWRKARLATGWIQAMDGFATRRLWAASKYYVENTLHIRQGSDGYWDKVSEMYNRALEETQPNYTAAQRPELLRNTSTLQKTLTMFMTQRLQNTSIVTDAVGRYNSYAKSLKAKDGTVTASDVKEAKKQVVSAVSSQLVSAACIVAFKLLANALRHNFKPYRDDDDELTGDSFRAALLDQYIETIVGNVWLGSNIYSFVKAATGHGTMYDFISASGVDGLNDAADHLVKLCTAIGDDEPDSGEIWKAFQKVFYDGCQVAGVPAKNAVNLGNGFRYWVEDAVTGNWLESDVDRTAAQNTSILYRAYLAGDTDKIAEMTALMGEDKATSKLKEKIKKLCQQKRNGITAEEAVQQLQQMCGMDETEAKAAVDYWKQDKATRESINISGYENYYKYVKAAGVEVDTYVETVKNADGYGKDGNANGSLSQAELGSYLKYLIKTGVVTKDQAAAIWKAKFHGEKNKSFAEWLSNN